MLEHFQISGFRALKDFRLDLPAGVPLVLIGENATGKSSILDAMALIRAVAGGWVGREILDRGGWQAVAWRGESPTIQLTVRFAKDAPPFEKEGGQVEYAVTLGTVRSVPTVLSEQIRIYKRGLTNDPLCVLEGGARRRVLSVQTQHYELAAPAESDGAIVTNSVLSTIVDETRYPTVVRVREALQSIAVYPPFALDPSGEDRGPRTEPLGARPVELTRRIKRSGQDLLNALHTLSQQHTTQWTALLNDLTAVFPWCDSLRFPPGPGRGLLNLTWIDRRSGATLYLDDMSSGMRVYLALLAALHAPDRPSLLAFDEPERSLHPHALRRLVKVIESRAEQVPILVATHSDRLLDFLEAPSEVLRITRHTSESGVTLETIAPDVLQAWLAEYTLSELRAREMLEAPAAPPEKDAL